MAQNAVLNYRSTRDHTEYVGFVSVMPHVCGIAVGVLPAPLARPLARLEPYGMMILMSLFVLSYAMVRMGAGFSLLGWLVGVPTQWLIRLVLAVTGQG